MADADALGRVLTALSDVVATLGVDRSVLTPVQTAALDAALQAIVLQSSALQAEARRLGVAVTAPNQVPPPSAGPAPGQASALEPIAAAFDAAAAAAVAAAGEVGEGATRSLLARVAAGAGGWAAAFDMFLKRAPFSVLG